MRSALFAALFIIGLATPADAQFRITGDYGGQIGPYLEQLAYIRDSGQTVIIDGPCLSACTLVLGVIPSDRICVTPRARLGFHAAWSHDQNGRPQTHRGGTQLLMAHYPAHIKSHISRNGGLSQKMIWMTSSQLASNYQRCR